MTACVVRALASALILSALVSPALAQGSLAEPAPSLLLPAEGQAEVLTLAQARALALAHHPQIKAQAEAVTQAEVLRWRAWAILLPRVFLEGSITRNDKEMSLEFPDFVGLVDAVVAQRLGQEAAPPSPGQATVIQELWGQHFGFTASIPIFNAQSIPLVRMAYDNIEAARLQARFQRSQLAYAVSAAYYGAHAGAEDVRIAQDNLHTAQEFLRLAERLQSVGTGLRIDALKAQIAVAGAEKAVADALDRLRLARASLAYLTGRREPFVTVAPPAPTPRPLELGQLQRSALEERLDLRAARIQANMALRDREQTWAKFVPSFDLTYNYSWDSATGFGGEHESWRLIFGAKWTLLEGGDRIAELDQKASLLRQAGYQLDGLVLSIREEVEKAAVAIEGRQRNLQLVAKQLALAEESHRLVSTQYASGLATGVELLDATTTLSVARRAQVLEALQHQLAWLTLDRALGQGQE